MTSFALPPAETYLPFSALTRGLLPLSNSFLEKLKKYLGVEHCVQAANARTLLYLLFCALRDRASDHGLKEVLLPGYTCYSVAAAAVKAGLKVNLYDLDPATFQPDFEDVRRKIHSSTLAVIGQHLLGVKSDINELERLARRFGACCIEDSAQRMEASQYGAGQKMAADYVVLSFGRGKPLPLGGGGALVAKAGETCQSLSCAMQGLAAQRANPLLPFAVQFFSQPRLYGILDRLPLGLGRTIYDPTFKAKSMSTLHQRIGEGSLAYLAKLNQHRKEISRIYQFSLGGKTDPVFPYIRFPLLLMDQSELQRWANYGVRRLYPLALIDLQPLQPHLVRSGEKLPGAQEIAQRLVTMPTHLKVDKKMAMRLAREFEKINPILIQ